MLLDIQIYWPSPTNWHFPDDSFYPTTPVRHLVIRTKFPDTNLSVALITTISQSEPQLPPNWSPRQTQKLALSQSQSQVIKLCSSHSQMSHPNCLPVKPNLSLSLSRASSHAPRHLCSAFAHNGLVLAFLDLLTDEIGQNALCLYLAFCSQCTVFEMCSGFGVVQ